MKKVKCVRAVKVFREDYEPGKEYEVEDELADRLLRYTVQVGPSHHKAFILASDAKKEVAKKTAKKATKKTAKKATNKKTAKKSASSKGPAHPLSM